jgi:eukaryotic-like serine/threonine-protein kinase
VRLMGRYTLVGGIGRGGMSEVWRAHDLVLGRPVAIKVLAPELTSDPALRAALWREAQAAARLSHPHVARIYDYGEASLGGARSVACLVMEVIEGQSLAERLSAGPLRWIQATRIGAQVAAALAAAHAAGIVHRDVKPGNVMLTATGAKVLDFGIAALPGVSPEHDRGLLFGTPAYAAPERLKRAPANPAGDVYSLGALLYETLTGRPPLPIATWAEAARIHARRTGPVSPHVAGLPPEASGLVMACLAADPVRRPSAAQVAVRLARVSSAPGAGHPVTIGGATPRTLAEPPAPLLRPFGDAAGRSVAAAARVVRRPQPLSVPDFDQPNRPQRSALALVGGAGALVAAGLALTLLGPALSGDPAVQGAAPAASATTYGAPTSPSERVTAPRPSRPWSTPAEAVLAEIDRILEEAISAGRVPADVGRDLRDELDDLGRNLTEGRPPEVGGRLDKFLAEVRDRLQDGSIPPQIAAELLAAAARYTEPDDG